MPAIKREEEIVLNIELPTMKGTIREVQYREKQGKAYFQVNGKVYGPYLQAYVLDFIISPDGNHFAYRASQERMGKDFYVIDGKEGKSYKEIFPILFSPDSQQSIYIAKDKIAKGNQEVPMQVVINGSPSLTPPFGPSVSIKPYFTPDSKNIVYWTQANELLECPAPYKGLSCTKHSSYLAVKGKMLSDSGDWLLRYQPLQFSPDGKKVGYLAIRKNELWWVVKEI